MQSTHSNPTAPGFTLVELLIISPLVIAVVAVMVGFAVSLTGDALSKREEASMTYMAQSALDRIEQDVRLSDEILATSGTLPSPQGRDSSFAGTSAFTSSDGYLILRQYATSKNPYDSSRTLIHYSNQPNPCGSSHEYNDLMSITVIYYLTNSILKRRTIVPDYTSTSVCSTPWQRNSCSSGLNAATRCRAADEVIAEDVTSLSFVYFLQPGDSTPIATPNNETSTVFSTIELSKTVAGRPITATSVMRASAIGIQ